MKNKIISLLSSAQALAKEHYGISDILRASTFRAFSVAAELGKNPTDPTFVCLSASMNKLAHHTKAFSFQIPPGRPEALKGRFSAGPVVYFGLFNDLVLGEVWTVGSGVIVAEIMRRGAKRGYKSGFFLYENWVYDHGERIHPGPADPSQRPRKVKPPPHLAAIKRLEVADGLRARVPRRTPPDQA